LQLWHVHPDPHFLIPRARLARRSYLFGLVTCAPEASPGGGRVWALKPHNYCAGLPFPLAALAVNLATRLRAGACAVVDPCAGSGTLLFAAACAGARAVAGVEREAALVGQAAANLAATSSAAAAARRQLADAASAGVPPRSAEDAADAAMAPALTPRVLCADSGRVRFGVDRSGALTLRVVVRDDADAADDADAFVRRDAGDADASSSSAAVVDAFVSNLPYGRVVGVARDAFGDAAAEGHLATAALAPLLAWLRPQARRHAYFSGVPLAPMLTRLGFGNVREVCVDEGGRRFLCLATRGADAEEEE
jgi:hypothetical protein